MVKILEKVEITKKEFYENKPSKKPGWKSIVKAFLSSNAEAMKIKADKISSATASYIRKIFPNIDAYVVKTEDGDYLYICKRGE